MLIGQYGYKLWVGTKAGRRNKELSLSHKWRASFKPVVEALRGAVVGVFEDSFW